MPHSTTLKLASEATDSEHQPTGNINSGLLIKTPSKDNVRDEYGRHQPLSWKETREMVEELNITELLFPYARVPTLQPEKITTAAGLILTSQQLDEVHPAMTKLGQRGSPRVRDPFPPAKPSTGELATLGLGAL